MLINTSIMTATLLHNPEGNYPLIACHTSTVSGNAYAHTYLNIG